MAYFIDRLLNYLLSYLRRVKLKKELPELDEKCVKVFTVLVLNGELRFKELKNAVDMNEATLLIHLSHLVEKQMVVKKVLSHKNVTYRPNIKKLEEFKTYIERSVKRQNEMLKLRKDFFDMPIGDQLNFIVVRRIEDSVEALKYRILHAKYGRFEDMLLVMLFESQSFKILENLMVNRCSEETEYRNRVLEAIELKKKELKL